MTEKLANDFVDIDYLTRKFNAVLTERDDLAAALMPFLSRHEHDGDMQDAVRRARIVLANLLRFRSEPAHDQP